MDTALSDMHRLLGEIADHLKSAAKPDKSAAAAKLTRIAALATTLAFTIEATRR